MAKQTKGFQPITPAESSGTTATTTVKVALPLLTTLPDTQQT